MKRIELSAVTRVRSAEDIQLSRRAKIEVLVDPWAQDSTIIEGTAQQMRSLARMLRRHANFIDPPKTRRKA